MGDHYTKAPDILVGVMLGGMDISISLGFT